MYKGKAAYLLIFEVYSHLYGGVSIYHHHALSNSSTNFALVPDVNRE